MDCSAPAHSSGPSRDYASEPNPGPSWRKDPVPGTSRPPMPPPTSATSRAYGGEKRSSSRPVQHPSASTALSITSLAVERHQSEDSIRSVQPLTRGLTRVQASQGKIILDDHQTGYLAVVPPDLEGDLVSVFWLLICDLTPSFVQIAHITFVIMSSSETSGTFSHPCFHELLDLSNIF